MTDEQGFLEILPVNEIADKNVGEIIKKHGWRKLLNSALDSAAFWQHHAEEIEEKCCKLVEAAYREGWDGRAGEIGHARHVMLAVDECWEYSNARKALAEIDKPAGIDEAMRLAAVKVSLKEKP